jgi:hypothetical protein
MLVSNHKTALKKLPFGTVDEEVLLAGLSHGGLEQLNGDLNRHDLALLDVGVDEISIRAAFFLALGAEQITRREVAPVELCENAVLLDFVLSLSWQTIGISLRKWRAQKAFLLRTWMPEISHIVPLPAPGPPRTNTTFGRGSDSCIVIFGAGDSPIVMPLPVT